MRPTLGSIEQFSFMLLTVAGGSRTSMQGLLERPPAAPNSSKRPIAVTITSVKPELLDLQPSSPSRMHVHSHIDAQHLRFTV